MVVSYYLVLLGVEKAQSNSSSSNYSRLLHNYSVSKDIFEALGLGVENSQSGVELLGGATAWAIPLFTTPD